VSVDAFTTVLIVSALVAPFPVLAAVCWWFWKSRNDT
jgi:hypothetical protein